MAAAQCHGAADDPVLEPECAGERHIVFITAVHHARGIERGQIDDAVHAFLVVDVGRGLALLVAAHAKAEQVVERDRVIQRDALVVESVERTAVALQAGAQ